MFPTKRYKRRIDPKEPKTKVHKPLHVDETHLAAGMTQKERDEAWEYYCQACIKCKKT